MKISHWFIVAGLIAPLFACSSSDDSSGAGSGGDAGSGTGGSGGSVIPSGGTGGTGTGGTGAGETGGTGATGGTGETGGTGGTGGTGTTVEECKASGYTDPTCGSCMEANCVPECEACMADPACMGWLSCVLNNDCATQECYDACTGDYPGGDVTALAWFGNDGCIGTKCGTECGVGGGEASCDADGYTDPTCGTCMAANCKTECEACMADPACMGWLSCVINNDCTTQACYDDCTAANPGGDTLALAWFGNDGCIGTACSVECDAGGGEASCDADGYTDPTCGACMATNCTTECEACLADAACTGWLSCVINNDCTTEACYDDCTAANPGGDTLALAWFGTEGGCISKCETECN